MIKLAKISYGINGATCVFIGILHTVAHYSDLDTPHIKALLNPPIVVSGTASNIWDLWLGMSLMMGYLLMIIGMLHLSILIKTRKNSYPPLEASIIMILMLLGVIYTGYYFFGSWQIYGGITGIFLQSICLSLTILKK